MIYMAVTLNAKYLEPFVNHEGTGSNLSSGTGSAPYDPWKIGSWQWLFRMAGSSGWLWQGRVYKNPESGSEDPQQFSGTDRNWYRRKLPWSKSSNRASAFPDVQRSGNRHTKDLLCWKQHQPFLFKSDPQDLWGQRIFRSMSSPNRNNNRTGSWHSRIFRKLAIEKYGREGAKERFSAQPIKQEAP